MNESIGTIIMRLRKEHGMTQDQLSHIWDRFYQADAARNSQDGSLGLGLSMAQEIVRLHRGKISAESEQDEGSTFTVILPLASRE